MDQKKVAILGWMGTCLSIIMYVSYVFVIMGNLSGIRVDLFSHFAATFNCIVWFAYGFFKEKRDYLSWLQTLQESCLDSLLF